MIVHSLFVDYLLSEIDDLQRLLIISGVFDFMLLLCCNSKLINDYILLLLISKFFFSLFIFLDFIHLPKSNSFFVALT